MAWRGNSPLWDDDIGLLRVVTPWKGFVAGLEIDRERVVQAAPIMQYMVGWTLAQVYRYTRERGWNVWSYE